MRASGGSDASPRVTFGDLPDKLGRYAHLKENESYARYQMCIPPVFDIRNNLVNPLKYRDEIPDGTLVVVRGKLKMWVFYLSHLLSGLILSQVQYSVARSEVRESPLPVHFRSRPSHR